MADAEIKVLDDWIEDNANAAVDLLVPFEAVCLRCGGWGKLREGDRSFKFRRRCPQCEGLGAVPSAQGEALLRFILNHLHISSSALEMRG